jgi:uncharacterized membrane protein
VAAIFGPLVVGVGIAAVHRRHAPSALACVGLLALLAWAVAQGGVEVNRLYVLQHAGIHAALAWSFAITLRPGATPRITGFAERVHEQLTPAMRTYTRRLTAVWVAYFGGMVVVSLALSALAPWAWWSFYANVLTPLAAVALFVGEYALRYRLHPEFERITMIRALRAYQGSDAAPARDRAGS